MYRDLDFLRPIAGIIMRPCSTVLLSEARESLSSATKSGPLYIGTLGMLRLFLLYRRQVARDRWTPQQLREHQQAAQKRLRDHAYGKSPFYRRFHKGLYGSPLEDLPVLTKAELMKNWDEVVTDKSVRLREVQDYVAQGDWSRRFRDKYYVNTTSGTTGLRGIFIYDSKEWLDSLVGTARMRDWAGLRLRPTNRIRQAVVTTVHPWHVTAASGASIQGRFVPILRIDITEPIDDIVAKLNVFQPEVLVTYPSFAKQLAALQMRTKLRISPKVVFTTSEVLSGDVKESVSNAWGVQPFDNYGATESSVIASQCGEHRGFHLYSDRVIVECVDRNNAPVLEARYSAKVLITVLSSRTLPLIRYELEDSVCPSSQACPCGRPFPLIKGIQGRSTEVIRLAGKKGDLLTVQPIFFNDLMEGISAEGWQVIQEGISCLRVSILRPEEGFDEKALKKDIDHGLAELGAGEVSIEIDYPRELIRNSIGKVILIKPMEAQSA